MTARIGSRVPPGVVRNIVGGLLAVLVLLAVTGCAAATSSRPGQLGRASPDAPSSPNPPTVAPPAEGTSSANVAADAALDAAVQFQLQRCRWDWRDARADYVAAQQQWATAAYGAEIAASSDPAAWAGEVVAGRQSVTCEISAAHRAIDAPSTATVVYVRLLVSAHVNSVQGSFDTGTSTNSWRVELAGGRWLVAGPFTGG